MKRPRSLVARLSRRLILLQILALTLVVIVASIPEPDRRDVSELDEDVLPVIAENLVALGDGLALREEPRIAALVRDYPGFWFLAADEQGRRAAFGPVPETARLLFGDPGAIIHAEIYREGGPDAGVIARRLPGLAGRITIVSGGGPVLPPVIGRLQRIDPSNLFFLTILTIALALTIPWLLRRDLSGVSRVADEAARIDIDQPGTRLTEANVPPELQGMVRAMNAALSRLDEGLEKRKRFLATAAHELRTPVAILTMRIELLSPGPERQQLMLDVARLSSLADQLLDLERLDGDNVRFVRLNLGALAGEAVTDIAPLAVGSGADLSFDAPEDSIEILADGQAILRVVTNLIQNAIAHGGRGVGIAVEVVRPAELRVRDNGPGIAPADRTQIFEPFFRRSSASGSGLGLHLVQEIVTRHGGTIQASEAPGGGAEFVVRFPAASVKT